MREGTRQGPFCLRTKQLSSSSSLMANLPPKPESPLKDDRRHDPRDGVTTARPMAPPLSPLSPPPPPQSRLSDSDRSYIPRSRPEADTYIAPYDSRRPWERDRPRDRDDRPRDRDYDRRRDSRRDWRDPDRRDIRPYDRRRDDDRFRPRRHGVCSSHRYIGDNNSTLLFSRLELS